MFPKGLCKMGKDCIYWHENPNKGANAAENTRKGTSAEKAKAKAEPNKDNATFVSLPLNL